MTWADSSFVLALYLESEQSPKAHAYLLANPAPMVLAAFSREEACHALRLCAFRREISEKQSIRYLHQFDRDQAEGFFRLVPVDMTMLFSNVAKLSGRQAVASGVRFLDLLHVAAAVQVKARRFLTFDRCQGRLATAMGLEVKP